jgi:hypothetical protein
MRACLKVRIIVGAGQYHHAVAGGLQFLELERTWFDLDELPITDLVPAS